MEENKVTNNNSEPVEARRLDVEVEKFPGTLYNYITTAKKLGETVNGLFNGVFSDYIGCDITIDEVRNINVPFINKVFLFFEDQGDAKPGMIKNLYKMGTAQNKSAGPTITGMLNLQERKRGVIFDLNDETKEYLEEFLPYSKNSNMKQRWQAAISERREAGLYGAQKIYIQVELDLIAILKKIYGTKVRTDNNKTEKMSYQVNSLRPIMNIAPIQQLNSLGVPVTNGYQAPIDYVINVSQLNETELIKVMNSVGIGATSPNTIPMVRSR